MIPFPWDRHSQDPTSLNRPFRTVARTASSPPSRQATCLSDFKRVPQPYVPIGRSYRKRR